MRKEKGITLVALVVTIVVLIILAGVSINTLVGEDGIIKKAQQAKENMELTQTQEKDQLNALYDELVNNLDFVSSDTGNQGGTTGDSESTENTDSTELQNKFDTLKAEYDSLQVDYTSLQTEKSNLQTQYDTFRSDIANAITAKGVTTQASDSSTTMVENIANLNNTIKITNLKTLIYGSNTIQVHMYIDATGFLRMRIPSLGTASEIGIRNGSTPGVTVYNVQANEWYDISEFSNNILLYSQGASSYEYTGIEFE